MSKLKEVKNKLNKIESDLKILDNPNTNLSHYFAPEFDSYKNGKLKRTSQLLSDQLSNFINQVSVNINALDRSDKLDILDRLKQDIEMRLTKVIV